MDKVNLGLHFWSTLFIEVFFRIEDDLLGSTDQSVHFQIPEFYVYLRVTGETHMTGMHGLPMLRYCGQVAEFCVNSFSLLVLRLK